MKKTLVFLMTIFMLLFVACTTKEVYTVTFLDINGEVIEAQQVEAGSAAIAPTAPEVENYAFYEWDQDFDSVYFDLEIQALYIKEYCVVTFVGLNNEVIEIKKVKVGEAVTAPTPSTYQDYTFTRWNKSLDSVENDMTVKGIYVKKAYTVTFVDKDGNIIKTMEVLAGNDAVAPSAPECAGYVFAGWDKKFTDVHEDLTVQATYEASQISYEITDYRYWLAVLDKSYNIDEVIMTYDEIKAYNANVLSDRTATKVVDVLSTGTTVTGDYVSGLINKYNNLNSYTVYSNTTKTAISTSERTAIANNRNLNNIPSTVNVQYGLIVDFAWMRTYPTKDYARSYSRDMFQETTLNVGEEVAIFHTSSDSEWMFVQARNYFGWVETKNIAISTFDVVSGFVNAQEKIVVISDYVNIENAFVRMGQAFPLVSDDTAYVVKFPIRNADGSLTLKQVELEKTEDYSKGYLAYTYENLFKQAFKLLGINYSWGDKEKDGRDCSSTQNNIYASFGFSLPRNASNQRSIPTYGENVTLTVTKLKENYLPGTLIFSSGHVMMYIGEDESGVSYLFHNTSAGEEKCILQKAESYGMHNIIATLRLQ